MPKRHGALSMPSMKIGPAGVVRLEGAELRNCCRNPRARRKVPRCMTIALGSTIFKREVDHRPKQDRRRERIFPASASAAGVKIS